MGFLRRLVVIGFMISIVDQTNGNTIPRQQKTKRGEAEVASRFRGIQDKATEFDNCLQKPDSKDQELLNTFVMFDKNGAHGTKCKKLSNIGDLESGNAFSTGMRRFRRSTIQKRTFQQPGWWGARWTNGVVPYKIRSGDFSQSAINLIKAAMKGISDTTCITFKEQQFHNGQNSDSRSSLLIPFIYFCESKKHNKPNKCESTSVGRSGSRQRIYLDDPGCMVLGTVEHEILHALGMAHEHARFDRDDNIDVIWDNLDPDFHRDFEKVNTIDTIPYDMSSVMQYGLKAFSANNGNTLHPKHNRLGFLAGSRTRLSFYDIKATNDEYKCSSKCNKKTCLNEGYVNHKCNCYCPRGLTGPHCEYLDTDHDCGEIIDVSYNGRTIKTPNFPSNYPVGKICTWLIKTTKGKRIRAHFREIQLPHSQSSGSCYHWIEVKAHLLGQMGKRLCGVKRDTEMTTTLNGNRNKMMIIFDSRTVTNRPALKGAKVYFETIN